MTRTHAHGRAAPPFQITPLAEGGHREWTSGMLYLVHQVHVRGQSDTRLVVDTRDEIIHLRQVQPLATTPMVPCSSLPFVNHAVPPQIDNVPPRNPRSEFQAMRFLPKP